jgi:ElaB/YqjD/DUF883 family membrane-anchored ribosome-binding protein
MSRAESGNKGGGQGQQGEGQGMTQRLSEGASQVAGTVRDMTSQVRDAATEQYETLKDSATEYYQAGRDKAVEWQNQLEDYVREQPLKAVLMAAGVGVLLGIIWKRS